ncbi:MAG: DUF4412 domain-containing protein [Bacteroidia bacterium]
MFRNLLMLCCTFLAGLAGAQNFEGIIEFKKQTLTDTVNYVYSVKGDQVRIDEISPRTHRIGGSYLLNTKEGTTIYLNHELKTTVRRANTDKSTVPAGLTVTSSKETKSFFGYKCSKYSVTNTADNSSIHYYVASGKFTFFVPMLELLNRREDFSAHFLALPAKDGALPLLAVKYDAAGKEVGRLEAARIEKKAISASVFDVPKDYKEFK